MKKRNRNILIGIFSLIIILLVLYFSGFFGNLSPLAITPTAGCQFVQDPSNPSSEYSNITPGSRFTCDVDECIVSGSMSVTKPVEIPKVIFRTSGDYGGIYGTNLCVGYDFNADNLLEGKKADVLIASTTNFKPQYIRSDGLGFKLSSERSGVVVDVGYPTSTQWKRVRMNSDSCSIDQSITSKSNCNAPEVCDIAIVYDATFNFCPVSDPNFLYCSGSKNFVSSQTAGQTYFTEEKKIIRNDIINFNPKYSDNSLVENKFIRAKKYDCSCIPAIQQGTACSSDQYYCKSQVNACPSGTTFYTNSRYCSTLDGRFTWNSIGNVCRSSSYSDDCSSPINLYNSYKKCDSTQLIGQSTCGAFGSTLSNCPTGQECILDSTGQRGEGIGRCKCPTSPCSLLPTPEKKKLTETSYQECISIGQCSGWSSEINCAEGLVFDDSLKKCIIPPETTCNPQESECIDSKNIKRCKQVTIGGVTGYQFPLTAEACPGELGCYTRNNNLLDDVCSCDNMNLCKLGEISCISPSTYSECSKDINNPSTSCLKFRGSKNVDFGYECKDNQIVQRSDIGCQFNTPGYECSSLKDKNVITIEQCTNNKCISTQDIFTSTETDYLSSKTKCYNGNVMQIAKYLGTVSNSYRWEIKETCSGENICIESSGIASCKPGYSYIGILTKPSYGIGEPIKDIIVDVTSEVSGTIGSNINAPIVAQLFDGAVEVGTRVNTYTGNDGKATLDFKYSHPKSGQLKIELTVGNPAGANFKQSKLIEIKTTLEVKPLCPIVGYINRDISCTWSIKNIDTGNLVDATPKIKVTQGTEEIAYTPSGKTGLIFKTSKSGNVIVQITAEKEGFISGIASISIPIQSPTIASTFNLDKSDFFTYSNTGISTGTHELELILEESGETIQIQNIESSITTPTGQKVKLYFKKASTLSLLESTYRAVYNFQQPGQTYEFEGVVYFTDIAKEPLQFNYKIATTKSATEDLKGQYTLIIIGISVGIFILLAIIIIIVLVKRRK